MKKQLGILVLSLFVFLALLVVTERAFSPPFQQCVGASVESNQADTSKKQNATSGSAVYRYIRCTGDFLDSSQGTITALATLIIAAFTCTLWLATNEQAKLTREAFIADKRAFVFAKGFNAHYEPGAGGNSWNWRFSPVWENSGDTPTRGCMYYSDGILMTAPITSGFDLAYLDPQHPPGAGMLGPKSMSPAGMVPRFGRAAITPQDILDIQAGNKFFYLWGSARYRDTLPGSREHITRFCWLMLPNGDPTTFNPIVNRISVTWTNVHQARGNCADDECTLQGLG